MPRQTSSSAGNFGRAAALAVALLAGGCASDVPVPFMDLSIPVPPVIPASHPSNQPAAAQQAFPAIVPPVEREDDQPVMNDVERVKLEQQLEQLRNEREAKVKQRIERAN